VILRVAALLRPMNLPPVRAYPGARYPVPPAGVTLAPGNRAKAAALQAPEE